MKRLSLLLIFGSAMLFFGCQKDQAVIPDEGDQPVSELKVIKHDFSGFCVPTDNPIECGVVHELPNGNIKVTGFQSIWHDETNDPLTTGLTYWNEDMIFYADGKTSKAWGKATLVLDNDLGEWDFTLNGISYIKEGSDDVLVPICEMDLSNPPEAIIYGVCKGIGKSGAVKGMVGEWTYRMDMQNGLFYTITGWYKYGNGQKP